MDITFEIWTKVTSTILFRYFSFASISFVLFYVILKKPLWYRKIQKKIPKLTDYKRDIFWSLITITIFATVIIFTFVKFNHLTNTYKNIEEYYRFITPNVTKTYLIIKIDRYPPIIVLIYACYIYSTKYIYTRFCNISVSTVIFDL